MKKLNYTIEGKKKSDDQIRLEKLIEASQKMIELDQIEISRMTRAINARMKRIEILDKRLQKLLKITPSK